MRPTCACQWISYVQHLTLSSLSALCLPLPASADGMNVAVSMRQIRVFWGANDGIFLDAILSQSRTRNAYSLISFVHRRNAIATPLKNVDRSVVFELRNSLIPVNNTNLSHQ
jgi:hypothetical protein